MWDCTLTDHPLVVIVNLQLSYEPDVLLFKISVSPTTPISSTMLLKILYYFRPVMPQDGGLIINFSDATGKATSVSVTLGVSVEVCHAQNNLDKNYMKVIPKNYLY